MVVSILLTLFLLSILVFVHELGHFVAAKLMKIRVLEFALFMGPKLFSFKKGETIYSIRCIPIGGFCSMEGEETSSDDERAYSNKKWYKKALVLIAGPAMNILLAIILTIIFFFTNGYGSIRIGDVIPGSEAYQAGIRTGDKIVAFNGMGVSSDIELGTYEEMYKTDDEFIYTIKKASGEKVDIAIPSRNVSEVGIRKKSYSTSPSEDARVYINSISKNNKVEELGIKAGDKIVSMNGTKIDGVFEWNYFKSKLTNYPMTYEIEKSDGEIVSVTLGLIKTHEEVLGVKLEFSGNDLVVKEVKEDSITYNNGIVAGSKVISLNGIKINDASDWNNDIKEDYNTYEIEDKNGEIKNFNLNRFEEMGVTLKAGAQNRDSMDQGVFTVLGDTVTFTGSLVKVTVKSLAWLITGRASADDVSGPVGMISIVNETVTGAGSFNAGLFSFMILAILISVNLGVFNILPFPALDGGRLIFAIIEGIRGKKIKPEHEGIVSLIGFVILIGLSILIFIKDIIKLFN